MSCTAKNISQLLSEYHSNKLDDLTVLKVETHLINCKDCRETLKTMEILSGQIDPSSPFEKSGHLKDDMIIKYYENGDLLQLSQLREIENHIENCDDCAYELEFLNSLEQDLNLSLRKELEGSHFFEKIINFIPKIVQSPVLAYFLLALAIYPSYQWYSSIQDGAEIEIHPLLSQNVVLLEQPKRGQGEVSTLLRSRGELISVIDLQVDHLEKLFDYDLIVSSIQSDARLKVQSITDLSRIGVIGISLYTAMMDDGDYLLTLYEIDRESLTDTISYLYPFKLVTRE